MLLSYYYSDDFIKSYHLFNKSFPIKPVYIYILIYSQYFKYNNNKFPLYNYIVAINNLLNNVQQNINNYKNTIQIYENKQNDFTLAINNQNNMNQELQLENEKLNEIIKILEQKNSELENELSKMINPEEYNNYIIDMESKMKVLKELSNENGKLRAEVASRSKGQSNIENYQNEINQLKNNQEQLIEKIRNYENEIDNLKSELSAKSSQFNRLNQQSSVSINDVLLLLLL